jgi:hypothetical protein
MITGDSLQTATAIALQTRILLHADERLDPLKCTTADQFDACDDEDLDSVRSLPLVIARCSPHTKVKLVRALQRRHRVVAMTGGKGRYRLHVVLHLYTGGGGSQIYRFKFSRVLFYSFFILHSFFLLFPSRRCKRLPFTEGRKRLHRNEQWCTNCKEGFLHGHR